MERTQGSNILYYKKTIVHFICRGGWLYNRYINSTIRTKYLDDDGTGVKPKHFSQKHAQEERFDMEITSTVQEGNCGIEI